VLDTVLFVAVPYVSVVVAVLGGVYRYRRDRFSYSSFSSQFLESRTLFWGSVPWHYGIVVILLAHLLAALFPGGWARLVSNPLRLYALEVAGLALAVAAAGGLLLLLSRRLLDARVRAVTSTLDWLLLAALLVQVVLGIWVAFFYRWGSDWYVHTAVPWLLSLLLFHPRLEHVTTLPWVVKLHFVGGFVVLGLFPFTRLVHVVAFPLGYLWRPWQVVVWYRR